jgi:hypothetical protein
VLALVDRLFGIAPLLKAEPKKIQPEGQAKKKNTRNQCADHDALNRSPAAFELIVA